MDLATIVNPYDFSHPVSDPELFFGRTKELGEIRYYLDQASKTKRPVSLAILGDRAAGKTSLLNIIENESNTKKLFPVRIDLDETDIKDESRFFHKILNAVLIRAFDADIFGGRAGKTYATYIEMISAYVVPDSLEFAPWTFPVQYARGRANNRTGVALDDASFKEDLKKTATEVSQTIVLIFDECNVFRIDHYLLQKIRNIFMNLPGYMLVFSGTRELFPIMDEVFSPIIRQFKRIEIGAFTRSIDTRSCVEVPLTKAGVPSKQVAKLLSAADLMSDIHKLSGGRPYEIQLICHMLMRSCQMGQTKKFLLNLSVLEEIRSELAIGQDVGERKIVSATKGLPKRSLEALGVLCACDERMKFDDVWAIEWIVRGAARWSREYLAEQQRLLTSLGIIDAKENYTRFAGDDFERIYLKYVARQKQVTFDSWNVPSEAMFWVRLEESLSQRWHELHVLGHVALFSESIERMAVSENIEKKELDEAFFATPFAEELLTTLFAPDGRAEYLLIHGQLSANEERSACSLLWPIMKDEQVEKLQSLLKEMELRASEVNWRVTFSVDRIPKPKFLSFSSHIKSRANDVFCARLAATLGSYLVRAYIDTRDRKLAEEYVSCILELAERPAPDDLNNIGYVALSRGDYELAKKFFGQTLQSNDRYDPKLTLFNLGICHALDRSFGDALACLKRAEAEEEDAGAGCIMSLREDSNQVVGEEIFSVAELQPHIKSAIEICSRLADSARN